MGASFSSATSTSTAVGASSVDRDGDATELYLSQQMARRKEGRVVGGVEKEEERFVTKTSAPRSSSSSVKQRQRQRSQERTEVMIGAAETAGGDANGDSWRPPFAMQPWQWHSIGGRRPPTLRRSPSQHPPAFTGLTPTAAASPRTLDACPTTTTSSNAPASPTTATAAAAAATGAASDGRELTTAAKTVTTTATHGRKQALPSRGHFGRTGSERSGVCRSFVVCMVGLGWVACRCYCHCLLFLYLFFSLLLPLSHLTPSTPISLI